MMRASWLLYLVEVILVGLGSIALVNGLDCSKYKRINTTLYGFSHDCSSFTLSGDDKLRNIMRSGESTSFNITALYHECAGYACSQSYAKCSLACPCCQAYMGADPKFHVSIWTPDNQTALYMQNLHCIIPQYLPVITGYLFTCNFTGYGMANTTRLVQIQLSWNTMGPFYQPLSFGVYIIAGNMSLPDCIWQWERGNKFPLNEYGVFRILLYDGFGNKISAATGGSESSILAIDVQFRRYGSIGNESTGELRLDPYTTWKLTYQVQYGFCVITVYCTSVGKYQMKIIDEHNRALGNTPTTFYVVPDEAWAGTRFIPPPAPKTFFLGDSSEEKARAGVTVANGIAPAHVTENLLCFLLFLLVIFNIFKCA